MEDTKSSVRLVCLVGGDEKLRGQLSLACGSEVRDGKPQSLRDGDLVVLDARNSEIVSGGNPFTVCREIKENPRVGVFLLISPGDRYSREIARFCMANGCLVCDEQGDIQELESLFDSRSPRTKVSLDSLLARLERDLEGNSDRREAAVERMREDDLQDGFLSLLTDAETGLFDGPFATFKLDEEYKRATRFHQPLSLILLDCGIASWPEDASDRSLVLAEVASIFLSECRDIDTLARFTESEFLFLLPGTGVDGATAVARRMLVQLREHQYSVEFELDPVVGLATIPASGISDKREFLERAEACLAAARSGAGEDGLSASCE